MASAARGSIVRLHYSGKLDDGTVIDTSYEREPIEFTIGQGRLIPAFEQAIVGMQARESKTVTIPSTSAYGPYDLDKVTVVDRSELPPDLEIIIGMRVQGTKERGKTVEFAVIGIEDSKVTLDSNHPLVGRDLIFDVKLLRVL